MPSFLNSNQLSFLQENFQNHFETFSTGINNWATVFREPTKVINNIDGQNVYPYPEDSINSTDITYIPNSGIFPCMVISPASINSKSFTELKLSLDKNEIFIKVKEDAKNYIQGGKVELIEVRGDKYNLITSTPKIQNYFGGLYYYFKLEVVS